MISSKEATSILCFASGWHSFAAFSLWLGLYCSERSPSANAVIRPSARVAAVIRPPRATAAKSPCLRGEAKASAVAAAADRCAASATAIIIVATCAAVAIAVVVSGKICWSSATLCAAHYSLLKPCVVRSLTRLRGPVIASLISDSCSLAPCPHSHGGYDGVHWWNCFDFPALN